MIDWHERARADRAEIDRLRAANDWLTKAIEAFLSEWDDDGIAAADVRRFRAALAAAKATSAPSGDGLRSPSPATPGTPAPLQREPPLTA